MLSQVQRLTKEPPGAQTGGDALPEPKLGRADASPSLAQDWSGQPPHTALCCRGVASELILTSRNSAHAQGHANDLRDAQVFSHTSRIVASDLSDCRDADLVVVSAGTSQSSMTTSRFDTLREHVAIFRELIPRLVSQNPSANFLIASNPVDVLTYAAWNWSGLPPSRVLGSGTSTPFARV